MRHVCLTAPQYTFRTVDFRHTPPILISQLHTLKSRKFHAILLSRASTEDAEDHLKRDVKPKDIKHYLFFVDIINFHQIVNEK